jgi:selenocysteine lyase/cysteine desulfurase
MSNPGGLENGFMKIEEARAQFPALKEKVFLDAACVSLAPQAAVHAIESFLEMAARCPAPSSTLQHIAMDELRASARPQAARLISGGEDEIALVESTTHGLSLAAAAIPLERGDRVLLCDLEFLQVAVPWCQRRSSDGIEIDLAPNRDGRILVEDIAGQIGPRTRVVTISSVQWNNGFRCDLDALAALCRDRKVWLVVDAIQQLGAVPIDVRKTQVDILACGGHKWLNSPFGTGFLYIRRERLPELKSPLAGYMSMESPAGGWETYFETPGIHPVHEFRFVSTASRFEIGGTANYPGATGLAASLGLINDLGPSVIADYIFGLTDHLINGLCSLGLAIVTPTEREHRSGIVTFSAGGAERNIELMRRLLERKILVSVRYTSHVGGVRVSCHFYNNMSDIDRLLNALQDCV